MTRFDADDPDERRKLFADAIAAHRDRGSPYLTLEAERGDGEGDERSGGGGSDGRDDAENGDRGDPADDASGADAAEIPPWIQFADRTFNVDCTDEELSRLKSLLSEFPAFRIEQLETPEEAEGTNVRITARSDANRLADFAERTFREVYDLEEGYRAWVVEI